MIKRIKTLIESTRGSMAIETAIVAPVLILMTLGTFEVGTMVARQHELQSAANEAEIIVMSANQGASIELSDIKAILQSSVDVSADNISVEREYRCALNQNKTKIKGNCPTSGFIMEYINIRVRDTYTPTWTAFGIGREINYEVDRSVLLTS